MHVYEQIKDMLCAELEDYADKREMSTGDLDVIDKLTHSIKSLETIIAMEDAGYSGRYPDDGRNGRSYNRGASYARGNGRGRGTNARRDSMGRYSSDGDYSMDEAIDDMMDQLRDLKRKSE